MERNTVEGAVKTETDTKIGLKKKKKERASSVGFCRKRKPQHFHHAKGSPWGQRKRRK